MSKPIRILLVDEHTVVRDALRALITTAEDMKVVGEAADWDSALEQARKHLPDIIILDFSMLGSEGISVLATLADTVPNPCILILTNEENMLDISNAIDIGVKGYLPKGTSAPDILETVRALSRGKSVFDLGVTRDMP